MMGLLLMLLWLVLWPKVKWWGLYASISLAILPIFSIWGLRTWRYESIFFLLFEAFFGEALLVLLYAFPFPPFCSFLDFFRLGAPSLEVLRLEFLLSNVLVLLTCLLG